MWMSFRVHLLLLKMEKTVHIDECFWVSGLGWVWLAIIGLGFRVQCSRNQVVSFRWEFPLVRISCGWEF